MSNTLEENSPKDALDQSSNSDAAVAAVMQPQQPTPSRNEDSNAMSKEDAKKDESNDGDVNNQTNSFSTPDFKTEIPSPPSTVDASVVDEEKDKGHDNETEQDLFTSTHESLVTASKDNNDDDDLFGSDHDDDDAAPLVQAEIVQAPPLQSILKEPTIASRQKNASDKIQKWISKPAKQFNVQKQKQALASKQGAAKAPPVAPAPSTTLKPAPVGKAAVKAATQPHALATAETAIKPAAAAVAEAIQETEKKPAPAQVATSAATKRPAPSVDSLAIAAANPATTAAASSNVNPGSLASIALGINIRKEGEPPLKRRKQLATKTVKKIQDIRRKSGVPEDPLLVAASQPIPNPRTPSKPKEKKSAKPGSAKKTENPNPRPPGPSPMSYEGPPTKVLPGGWPDGWVERRFKRMGGDTVDREDSYFYPPTEKEYKLRSIKEVQRFIFAFNQSGGDAAFAYKQRKNGPVA